MKPAVPAAAPTMGDVLFKRVIAGSTGLAFSGMLASLALIERGDGGKLVLRWHWAAIPLFLVGLMAGLVFWRLVWRAEAESTGAAQGRLIRFSALLGVMALVSFAYPLRFVQAERRTEVLIGLGLAIAVLSGFGWLIFKTIQWLNQNEPKDGEVEAGDDPEPPAR